MSFQKGEKTALVTGAAKRIGAAISKRLVTLGYNLLIHYGKSEKEANALANWAQNQGVEAAIVQADLGDLKEVKKVFQAATAFKPIDVLINNASMFEEISVADVTEEQMLNYFNLHANSAFVLARAFARQLPGQGAIINMLDWQVISRPNPVRIAYTTSKAALASLTKSLAVEFAPRVRVNGLALGAILPPSTGEAIDQKGWIKNVPLERWGSEVEIADAVEFLIKEPNYITGEILHIDGGRHLV